MIFFKESRDSCDGFFSFLRRNGTDLHSLVCHLAASCFLNPKPVIAKLLAAAIESKAELKGSYWSVLELPRYCMGLLVHRVFWKGAICYILGIYAMVL